tara:strand:- start:1464 stop:2216 length:753 start_codon:yes stop_codon:yes gene_type:complete
MIRYAIPSYNRPDSLTKRTGKTIVDAGVDPGLVDVYVAGEEQAEMYAEPARSMGFNLKLTTKGVREARNTIHSSYAEGTNLVVLDDDLNGLLRKVNDKKVAPVTDLPKLTVKAFREVLSRGLSFWGIYPTANAMFMKHRTEFGLRFCIGQMYGIVIREPHVTLECETKEDYELSLIHYVRDGAVMRMDYIAAKSKVYSGQGGLQSDGVTARKMKDLRSIRKLTRRYPELVRMKKTKSDYPEISLVRKGQS